MRSMNKRKKKDDDDDNSVDEYSGFNNSMSYYDLDDSPVVDLSSLQVNTLRRYKRHYRIPTKPGINKSQLVEVSLMVDRKFLLDGVRMLKDVRLSDDIRRCSLHCP